MKSELKAKFLQHLISKKKEGGFTLIELLVVIIIIGILSAIALPSFLNQAAKGKQSEAKQYVGTLNRAQQSFFAENGKFADDLNGLSNPITSQTTNYTYQITNTAASGTKGANVTNAGSARTDGLKSYAGMVGVTTTNTTSDSTTTAALCETTSPNKTAPTMTAPAGAGTNPTCAGATLLN